MRDLFKKYKPIILRENLVNHESLNDLLFDWINENGDDKFSKNNFIGEILNNALKKEPAKHHNFIKYYSRKREILCLILSYYNDMRFNISDIHAQICYCDLLSASTHRFKMTATLMTSKCCPECEIYNGETVPLEEMIENPLLPIKDCTRERGCFCWYGLRAIRGETDRLVLKTNFN